MTATTRRIDGGHREHEEVVFRDDPAAGLKGIVAIHDTTLGPALGGVRMWPYASEDEALEDVLRLSRAMTFKAAVAGLALGGGKAVIIGDPREDKSEALWRSFGRFVDSLGGRYIAAEDVGTSVEDLAVVARETDHAAGLAGGGGDPSPVTAYGVFRGMLAAARHRLGVPSLAGMRVAVQGLGHVGRQLCELLAAEGAALVVADLDAARVRRARARFGAEAAEASAIHAADVDIYAPCALGATINDRTIPEIAAAVVAGAANNQLAEDRHGRWLQERGILYAPDYVINAGGIINIACELGGYDRDRALARTSRIYDTLTGIFARADRERLPTNAIADRIAAERLDAAPAAPRAAHSRPSWRSSVTIASGMSSATMPAGRSGGVSSGSR